MKNGECGCNHRKDDETTGEVDATQEDLCDPYSNFDFLCLVRLIKSTEVMGAYKIFGLLFLQRSFLLLKVALLLERRAQDHAWPARRPWWRAR